jgi:serine/threonine protein kinase
MSLAAGTRLGPYQFRGLLGAGGRGEVYVAWDPRLGREVALKVLPPWAASDLDRLRRFEQEAKAAGALSHPNLLAVHDVGSHEGVPYIVSEKLEGETLRERLLAAAGRRSRRLRDHQRPRHPGRAELRMYVLLIARQPLSRRRCQVAQRAMASGTRIRTTEE